MMERGYTLIELSVVITIIAISLMVVAPRLMPSLAGSRLEVSARELASFCRYLNAQAILTKVYHTLNIDIDRSEYWVTTAMATDETVLFPEFQELESVEVRTDLLHRRRLREGVRFEDVMLSVSGVTDRGTLMVEFTPIGLTERMFVHIASDTGRERTVFFDPVTGQSDFLDGYVQKLDQNSLGLGYALWSGENSALTY